MADGTNTAPLLARKAGEGERFDIMSLCNVMKQAASQHMLDSACSGSAEGTNRVAAAAATLCGALIGEMIVLGDLPQQQQRRAIDVMTRNIREGIEIGKRHVARVARETSGGTA